MNVDLRSGDRVLDSWADLAEDVILGRGCYMSIVDQDERELCPRQWVEASAWKRADVGIAAVRQLEFVITLTGTASSFAFYYADGGEYFLKGKCTLNTDRVYFGCRVSFGPGQITLTRPQS